MKPLTPGEIYALIDTNGEEKGFALFLEKCPPYSLGWNECKHANLWNFKVLKGGAVEYLPTCHWSLLTISDE